MFADVTTAEILAHHRAAELERRNQMALRREAARPASAARPPAQGHAAHVLRALHLAHGDRAVAAH